MQSMSAMNSNPQEAYRRQDVMTANSIDLIVMLYDALKKHLVLSKRYMTKKDVERTHNHLIKTQEIVAALISSLDMNYQISEELLSIYEFMIRTAGEANLHKNEESLSLLDSMVEIVDELRSAWHEISEANKGRAYLSEEQA